MSESWYDHVLYYLYGDPDRYTPFKWLDNKFQSFNLGLEKVTGEHIILIKVIHFNDLGLKLLLQKIKFESALCVLVYSTDKQILNLKNHARCEEIEIEDGYVLDFAVSSD